MPPPPDGGVGGHPADRRRAVPRTSSRPVATSRPASSRLTTCTAVASAASCSISGGTPCSVDEDAGAQAATSGRSARPPPTRRRSGALMPATRPAGQRPRGHEQEAQVDGGVQQRPAAAASPVCQVERGHHPAEHAGRERRPAGALVGVRQAEGDRRDARPAPRSAARRRAARRRRRGRSRGRATPRRPRRSRPTTVNSRRSAARPRQQGERGVPGGSACRPSPGRRTGVGGLQQRTGAQRAGGDAATKTSTSSDDSPGDRARASAAASAARPAPASTPGAASQTTRASSGQAPLEHEQPPVERPPGAGVGAQPALEPAVQHVPGHRLADDQVAGDDDRRQRGGAEVGRSEPRQARSRRAGSGLGAQHGQRAGEVGRVLAGELDPAAVGGVRRSRAGRRAATAGRRRAGRPASGRRRRSCRRRTGGAARRSAPGSGGCGRSPAGRRPGWRPGTPRCTS